MKNYPLAQMKKLISGAGTINIAVPQLSVDSIGAALAFALSLEKTGKKVTVFCPRVPDANYQNLFGLNKIQNKIDSSDLVITLDNYPLDQIEKASYNDDNSLMNLVVQFKNSAPKVQKDQINIKSGSGTADLNFIFGEETNLGENSKIVDNGTWIYISPINSQKPWAALSLIDQDAPYSEILTFLLKGLGLTFDENIGKNLLIGLRVATQSFSVNVSPESFEAGAICLSATQPAPGSPPAVTPPAMAPAQPAPLAQSAPLTQSTPMDQVEKSKSASIEGVSQKPNFNKPQILKGSTTPRV